MCSRRVNHTAKPWEFSSKANFGEALPPHAFGNKTFGDFGINYPGNITVILRHVSTTDYYFVFTVDQILKTLKHSAHTARNIRRLLDPL